MKVEQRPITLRAANRFVVEHHRHSQEVRGWLFGTSLWFDGELVAVGIAGRPIARNLDDGQTVEILRVCVADGIDLDCSCSRLYGALCRAAKALGHKRAVTYTLASESGVSPRAAGFVHDAEVAAAPSWGRESRPRDDVDLFGEPRRPTAAKVRWVRVL